MINDSETQFQEKGQQAVSEGRVINYIKSHVFNISIRAWVTLLLVGTVCFMSLKMLTVEEPLYSLVFLAVGHYFGSSMKSPITPTKP